MKTLIIPDNIRILFEDFCEGCELCKITTDSYEITNKRGYQDNRTTVSCDHLEACSRAFYTEGGEKA